MNNKHDYSNDPLYVTRQEIKDGLKEGLNKKLQMECFDISSSQYDRLKKGLVKAVRLGKYNGVVDIEEELEERRAKQAKCNYPITKCTCDKE